MKKYNFNHKFLEEAIMLDAKWKELGLDKMFTKHQSSILLESVCLRNEFNGTDEEYQTYLKEFGERFKINDK